MTTWSKRRGVNQEWGREKKNTLADSNYFYIEESIMCTNFLCTCNAVSMHVMGTVVTLHAICEGLSMSLPKVLTSN